MKQKYKLEQPQCFFEIEVEIDHSQIIQDIGKTDEAINLMVEFWANWRDNADASDNMTTIFLKGLAQDIFVMQAEKDRTLEEIIAEFDDKEGYVKMDGSYGIKILSVDSIDWECFEFNVYKHKS